MGLSERDLVGAIATPIIVIGIVAVCYFCAFGCEGRGHKSKGRKKNKKPVLPVSQQRNQVHGSQQQTNPQQWDQQQGGQQQWTQPQGRSAGGQGSGGGGQQGF